MSSNYNQNNDLRAYAGKTQYFNPLNKQDEEDQKAKQLESDLEEILFHIQHKQMEMWENVKQKSIFQNMEKRIFKTNQFYRQKVSDLKELQKVVDQVQERIQISSAAEHNVIENKKFQFDQKFKLME